MSANVEEEARARLDVAQLYEEMGQMPKALRYYLEAAQIYKEGGMMGRHRELCNKILLLDPENVQAKAELAAAARAAGVEVSATPPPPVPSASPSGQAFSSTQAKPKPGGVQLPPLQLSEPQAGKVLVPTPWLFRDPRYVREAKKQIPTALDRKVLNYDPLPQVDPNTVMIRQEHRRQVEEEASRRTNPRGSNFELDRPSAFAAAKKGSGLFGQASSPKAAAPAPSSAPRALGGGRSGNPELAEQIRRRLKEKGGS